MSKLQRRNPKNIRKHITLILRKFQVSCLSLAPLTQEHHCRSYSSSFVMKGRTCIILGVVGLLLGVLVILLGCFAIPYELPRQKTDYLVIDSEVCSFCDYEDFHLWPYFQKSAQYKDWAGGYDTKTEYQMVDISHKLAINSKILKYRFSHSSI